MFQFDFKNPNLLKAISQVLAGFGLSTAIAMQEPVGANGDSPVEPVNPIDGLIEGLFADRGGIVVHAVHGGFIAIDRLCDAHPKVSCFADEESAASYLVDRLRERRAGYEKWHADHEAAVKRREEFATKVANGAVMVAHVMAHATAPMPPHNGQTTPEPTTTESSRDPQVEPAGETEADDVRNAG